MSSFFKETVIRGLASAEDQAYAVQGLVGKALEDITLTGNDVILSVYIEKELNAGGIILPTQRLEESIYQSKVGLILKTGPDAFRFKGSYAWVMPNPDEIGPNGTYTDAYYERTGRYTPKTGDWVIHFPTDSKLFGLNGVPCRYALDSSIKMITTRPNDIL